MIQTDIDAFFRDGCGRCENFQTPQCKVLQWTAPLQALRALLQKSELTETMKWGSPTYTLDGKNVAMLVAFKERCALQFFKGALMEDPEALLRSPGPNSQHVRLLEVRSLSEVKKVRAAAEGFIEQAIALERSGAKVERKAASALPAELLRRFQQEPALARAFEALTPGRQRSHALHISGAKQAQTRERRVDACAELIKAGRGFNERD